MDFCHFYNHLNRECVTVYKLTLLPFIHGECKHAYFLYALDVNCQDEEMQTPSTTSHVSGERQCSLFFSGYFIMCRCNDVSEDELEEVKSSDSGILRMHIGIWIFDK